MSSSKFRPTYCDGMDQTLRDLHRLRLEMQLDRVLNQLVSRHDSHAFVKAYRNQIIALTRASYAEGY